MRGLLTDITLRTVRSQLEVDESHVRAADDNGDGPDEEDDQEGVPGGEAGGEGVEDAHVPEDNASCKRNSASLTR